MLGLSNSLEISFLAKNIFLEHMFIDKKENFNEMMSIL